MATDVEAGVWAAELESLLLRVGERFTRVEPRRRMRDYVRGLLGPVGRKNGWQLAEYVGHETPDGLQRLLASCRWEPDEVRDDLQEYVAQTLGRSDGVLILDDTGFLKKGITSAGVQRQYSGTAGRTENCQNGVFAAYASSKGRALVDRELYLPKSWTEDPDRCRAAGFVHFQQQRLSMSFGSSWHSVGSRMSREMTATRRQRGAPPPRCRRNRTGAR